MIYSFEEKMMKPDARLFQLVCERLGVLPEETVFLDDVENNVEGARSIGIHAIHFKSNEQPSQMCRRYWMLDTNFQILQG